MREELIPLWDVIKLFLLFIAFHGFCYIYPLAICFWRSPARPFYVRLCASPGVLLAPLAVWADYTLIMGRSDSAIFAGPNANAKVVLFLLLSVWAGIMTLIAQLIAITRARHRPASA